MRNFTFVNPTRIIFGRDTIKRLGQEVSREGIKQVLLVYGRGSIFGNGVYEQVTSSLQVAGISFEELSGVQPNPIISKVQKGIYLARGCQAQAVIAIGGGSVFDSAKAIAAGFYYRGDVWDFFSGQARIKQALPIYGVLTVSGTGSEMNSTAVVTREEDRKKWVMVSSHLYPRLSIIDPAVQASLPARDTAQGAVDIITHLLEVYFDGSQDVDIMKEYIEGLIRTVMKEAVKLLQDAGDYQARAQMAWAATLALNGSTYPGSRGGDWATHFMEHSLSAFYPVAHGTGLAVLLPAWMRYVYKNDPQSFERFAEKIFGITAGAGEERIKAGIDALQAFFVSLGIPSRLRDLKVDEVELEAMAANALLRGPLGVLQKLNQADVLEIYRQAW
ncbi:MAG: iron-containing alcohol dehydrogenase [Syntrophomonadaceae bacterium]|jgi:alcohol dehydrogenase YqhD (iron-dependent ADH family)